uniref:Uncharacterized protein n=1 Tax=Cucumis melo TaxID=3656 RepID=A0A9I9DQX8_CUCME
MDAKSRGCFFNANDNAITKDNQQIVTLLHFKSNDYVDIDEGEEKCKGRSLEIMEVKNNVELDHESEAVTCSVRHKINRFMVTIEEQFIASWVSRFMRKLLGN